MLFKAIISIAALASSANALTRVAKMKGQAEEVAAASGGLTYGNGPLLHSVQVQPLYWGTKVTYSYDTFYQQAVTSSTQMAVLAQYGSNLSKGSALAGITNTAGANSGTVKVSEVTTYIKSLVASGQIDPSAGNLYVPIHFGPVTVSADDGTGIGDSCTQWCAYHYSVNTSKGWVYYGIIPDVSYGACAGGCGSSNNSFENNCQVGSHELMEAITDPDQPQTGWTGPQGEIGDYCNDQSASFCGSDGYQYFVQTEWSNSANACVSPKDSGSLCQNGPATGGKGPVPTGKTTSTVKTTATKKTTTGRASSTVAPKCNHSECTTGPLLNKGCSACATAVCAQDSYCCTNQWDSQCVSEVNQYCTTVKC